MFFCSLLPFTEGKEHTNSLTSNGGVKCWGANSAGQLGDGTTIQRNLPVDVVGLSKDVETITAGGAHTCAVTTSGGVKCWGLGRYGQLGNSTAANQTNAVDVRDWIKTYLPLIGKGQ
ncbi:MAG: hypothetical protein Kow0088_04980 [Anaerolineales bacterium]